MASSAALVIGGGIAGMQAALDIANAGYKVTMVEKSPSIGGRMLQFSEVFPTLDCPQCIGTPKMVEVGSHPNISLMAYSEVIDVTGSAGDFKVRVRQKSRFVNASKCTSCGECFRACPVSVPNERDLGLSQRKAIYIPFAQAVPNTAIIEAEKCLYLKNLPEGKDLCRLCQKGIEKKGLAGCEAGAIDFSLKDEIIELSVGTIIVATGYEVFDARLKPEYGYGVYPNVITGLELERLDEAGGPTQGKILVNGKEPENIVFIQCVGSRDKSVGVEYCSRVCCMYTAKQVLYIKSKIPKAKVTVCYIDIRAFGKGYEQFYERVQGEGVIYRRGLVSEVYRKGEKLIVRGEDTLSGEVYEEKTDLVVLAVGIRPGKDTEEIGKKLGIAIGSDGFFLEAHPKLGPVETTVEGIYLAGCCQGPKDIVDSVIQGSAAAAMSMQGPSSHGKQR
jgi:heterodisulfide reductase subunit A2